MTIEITDELNARLAARQFAIQTALGRVNSVGAAESDIVTVATPIYDFLVADLEPKLESTTGFPLATEAPVSTEPAEPDAPREGIVQALITPSEPS